MLFRSKEYRYAHDEPDAFAAGEAYLPEAISKVRYYQPVSRGLEIKLREKRDWLDARNAAASEQRYPSDTPDSGDAPS